MSGLSEGINIIEKQSRFFVAELVLEGTEVLLKNDFLRTHGGHSERNPDGFQSGCREESTLS